MLGLQSPAGLNNLDSTFIIHKTFDFVKPVSIISTKKEPTLFSVLQLQLPQGLNNLGSDTILHQSLGFVKYILKKCKVLGL